MKDLPEVIESLEETAKSLQAAARRLRREKSPGALVAAPELAEADRALLELHHKIVHLLAEKAGDLPAEAEHGDGEIALDELTVVLYRAINPPESRRNYTYTPPFSIERVLKAYIKWMAGPGKGVSIRG